ncbi:MAG: hypothetical protein PWP45_658 [Tepidanaerobacteraceae bacterium]|uniref:DUF951 domain-containing protein n=2 Tax=Fervidicola ferrireducens TaxID=520764 RepID=A0A140L774_9FIRM|nr:DUF951 domain-containing protein [Fervidicola ferrireducens]KXG76399.1 hypothetical protein AN618_16390 [Fervidicola ferrireducens]MDN5331433.1 hypothetical protein [Tepidanaerobacteraceae bacterium]
MKFHIGDVVEMKKKHPCGSFEWEIWRMGADFGIKCLGCGRKVMIPRSKFEKSVKKIVKCIQPEDLEKPADK